jgi:hypothetical protein
MFLEKKINVRISKDIDKKAKWLLKHFRGYYENESHLYRCGVIKIYNEKIKEYDEIQRQKIKKIKIPKYKKT